jgi:PPOX class probable F420-dependent enzyme
MDEKVRAFLEQNHAAGMITLRRDGTPHAARVAVGLLDGRLPSSSTQSRVRTKNLRRDPRSTLFVFPGQGAGWLGLETVVTIREGPEVPELTLRYFNDMQRGLTPAPKAGNVIWFGAERTPDEFLKMMVEEGRLLYDFEVRRAYGMY